MFFYHCTYTRNYNSIYEHGIQPSGSKYCKSNYKNSDNLKDYVYLSFNPQAAEDFFINSDNYDGSDIIMLKINSDVMDSSKVYYDDNNYCGLPKDITSIKYKDGISSNQRGMIGITIENSESYNNKYFNNFEFLDLPYIDTFGVIIFNRLFTEWKDQRIKGV